MEYKNAGKQTWKWKTHLGKISTRVILLAYAVTVLFPMLWVLYTSFKSNKEFYASPWSFPEQFAWENYINAWSRAKIGSYFLNSVLVTVGMVVLTLILGAMISYVIGRYHFKGKSLVNSLFIGGLLVPSVLGTIPVFMLLKTLHLSDTFIGIILVYTAYALPFSVFVLIGFFKSLPKELEEAAMLDGASYYKTFFKIMAPMARPGLITVSIFNFLWYWNEYAFALVTLQSESKKTLPIGLAHLTMTQRYRTEWGELFAGVIIVMIPVIIVYILFQKKLVGGLNTGALKE